MRLFSPQLDLVLAAPAPCVAQMAQDLLAARGIPSILRGRPMVGEFGFVPPNPFTGPDVYVPRGARRVAQRILREAWEPEDLAPPPIEFESTMP